jgi:pyridoxal 5'-phosphate synthase pdxT subunit
VGVEIGVLALQGDVREHIQAFQTAFVQAGHGDGAHVFPLRSAEQIGICDAIAIPGGESTTISRLIDKNQMRPALERYQGSIFATCAGLVLIASNVDDMRIRPLGLMDIDVTRNAFGRQKESFEADLEIKGLSPPFHAIFIRAPIVTRAGPDAEILASIQQGIVAVSQGRHLAFAFHPELGGDLRLHRLFLDRIF